MATERSAMARRDMTLFVLLGAGASYDAASAYSAEEDRQVDRRLWRRPPLATQLFHPWWADIINEYPMVKNAAPNIRDAMEGHGGEDAVSLEDHLRTRYRDSEDDYDRRRYFSLPLYLQHLLWDVGKNDRLDPDNLNRLVNSVTERYAHVCFITLNYDTLLDRCLHALNPLNSLDAFIGYPRWSLIKLHGSITWSHRITNPVGVELNNPPADMSARIDPDSLFHTWDLPSEHDLRKVRLPTETFNTYPALSAPLGPDDELVCPPGHVRRLNEMLRSGGAMHLLVVGYSAYDQSALRILVDSGTELGSCFVVNRDRPSAVDAGMRLAQAFDLSINDHQFDVAETSFGNWVRGGMSEFHRWVDSKIPGTG
jgi:hypothetical protein